MTEKKYLKWYNKVGYGSGDIAGNVVYAFLSSFLMIFLTDSVGLNAGIVSTLMMISKLFDGVTDIFFGSMIDKTKTKMGKARPWMFWAYFGNTAMLIAIFMIPESLGDAAQYAYFFIAYTLLNAVFYTANNIAYASLTALITKNYSERVEMGSIRFMFAFGTSLLIQTMTVGAVELLGGGSIGWKRIAVIYAVVGLVVNTISVFSVRELPEDVPGASDKDVYTPEDVLRSDKDMYTSHDVPGASDEDAYTPDASEKYGLKDAAKLLISNKYYLLICGIYILSQIFTATLNMGIYFMKYVLGDANLLGAFSVAVNVPLICGLVFTPLLVKKCGGIYKVNLAGYALSVAARALVIVGGYMGSLPMMLIFSGLASIGMSPLQGDLNALIAECSEYTFLTKGKRIDGTMYSCSSLGVKIGSGIGTAMCGWMLSAGGYIANAVQQPQSCIQILHVMYLWIPMIINLVITFLLSRLKVEQANQKIRTAKNTNI